MENQKINEYNINIIYIRNVNKKQKNIDLS